MISVKDLTKTYSPGTRAAEEVLHGVSFELPETGFVCILGRSGSGKTCCRNTLWHTMCISDFTLWIWTKGRN